MEQVSGRLIGIQSVDSKLGSFEGEGIYYQGPQISPPISEENRNPPEA